jgi:pyruvate kinase
MKRRTKIVATMGPASQDKHTIRSLIQAGMDVARLNFSHGTLEQHAETLGHLRHYCDRMGKPLTIMQDLQGPKIRTGDVEGGRIELVSGSTLILTTETVLGSTERLSVDLPDLPHFLRPGSRILMADGHLELVAREIHDHEIVTEVVIGGELTARKGINLPGVVLDIPGFTEKDEADLKFGIQNGVDVIAMSFIRSPEDVSRVRKAIAHINPDRLDTPIIAKMERPEALENLDGIVQTASGLMVARGDLGVEMPPQNVPIAQKQIIEAANKNSRIVITATQMLESMIHNPRPSRAEATDVANAIFDGTDAVMLSAETAIGKYPVQAVKMMDAIIREAESHLDRWGHWKGSKGQEIGEDAVYLTRAASELAFDRNVAAAAVFTRTGSTPLLMSKARPGVPILGFTAEQDTYQRMNLYWGVEPHLVPEADTMESLLALVESALLAETEIQAGQQVVMICGFPVDQMRPSNLILLHTVGQHS